VLDPQDLNVDNHLKEMTIQAITRTQGCRKAAAKVLGISIRTLRNWINRFELRDKVPPAHRRQK
jgi:transposase